MKTYQALTEHLIKTRQEAIATIVALGGVPKDAQELFDEVFDEANPLKLEEDKEWPSELNDPNFAL